MTALLEWIRRRATLLIAFFLLVYVWFISRYADRNQPSSTALIRDTTESIEDLLTRRSTADIDRMHEFAILSAAVYEKKRDGLDVNYDYLTAQSKTLKGMWELVLEDYTEEMLNKSIEMGVSGLGFHIYRRTRLSKSGAQTYAIVFRGTDGLNDFWSNLHWLTKFIPGVNDQYDFVRQNTNSIIKKIREHAGDTENKVEIVVAGHSLGGGLAQQAAYAGDGIETVFAFDPSAVTGFYDVDKENRKRRQEKLRVYRIHERGEILAYLRGFMKSVYPVVQVSPKIVEIKFNFEDLDGNVFELHSIEALAQNLVKAWEEVSLTDEGKPK